MTEKPGPLVVETAELETSLIQIPGATPEGIEAQLLNIDLDRGIVATIIHFKPGAAIPAHFHENGSEAHYVLEGELIDGDRRCGPGTYLTHAAGVVHGPHRSEQGCKVLTIQGGKLAANDTDFHLADGADGRGAPDDEAPAAPRGAPSGGEVPPDMKHAPVPEDELMESQKTAPTPDNPTNPTTT